MQRKLALVIAVAGALSAPASASVLNAVNFPGLTPNYHIDQTTGAAGSVGGALNNIGDLTSDGGNRLWGVTLSGTNDLVQINPADGSVISSVAITGTRAGEITSIAYNPVTGRLYGNTTPGFGDAFGDRLYEIDPLTGAATLIGNGIGFNNTFALGFSQSGQLFGVSNNTSELISIDTSTGVGALVAGLQIGLIFDIASRPEDGVMFAVSSQTTSTYTLDTTNGNLTLLGAYGAGGNLVGLGFTGAAAPAPASLGLLGLGLAALGFSRRRRSA